MSKATELRPDPGFLSSLVFHYTTLPPLSLSRSMIYIECALRKKSAGKSCVGNTEACKDSSQEIKSNHFNQVGRSRNGKKGPNAGIS